MNRNSVRWRLLIPMLVFPTLPMWGVLLPSMLIANFLITVWVVVLIKVYVDFKDSWPDLKAVVRVLKRVKRK